MQTLGLWARKGARLWLAITRMPLLQLPGAPPVVIPNVCRSVLKLIQMSAIVCIAHLHWLQSTSSSTIVSFDLAGEHVCQIVSISSRCGCHQMPQFASTTFPPVIKTSVQMMICRFAVNRKKLPFYESLNAGLQGPILQFEYHAWRLACN